MAMRVDTKYKNTANEITFNMVAVLMRATEHTSEGPLQIHS